MGSDNFYTGKGYYITHMGIGSGEALNYNFSKVLFAFDKFMWKNHAYEKSLILILLFFGIP